MSVPTTDSAGIRRVIRALVADGWKLEAVEDERVNSETVAVAEVLAYDDAYLHVSKGDETGWVRFVMGNSPEEVAADYTVNLTAVEAETETWWED